MSKIIFLKKVHSYSQPTHQVCCYRIALYNAGQYSKEKSWPFCENHCWQVNAPKILGLLNLINFPFSGCFDYFTERQLPWVHFNDLNSLNELIHNRDSLVSALRNPHSRQKKKRIHNEQTRKGILQRKRDKRCFWEDQPLSLGFWAQI